MNLAHLIESHLDGTVALIDEEGGATTYGDLRRGAAQLRARLAAAGVGPDDRVALIATNSPAFVVGYLAILGVGAVAVPLNPSSPAPELSGELGRVRVRALVTGPGAEQAGAGLDRSALGAVPVLSAANGPNALNAPNAPNAPNAETTEEVGPDQAAPIVDRRPDDLAVLLFTAGTSGSPRPAMLTHGNLLANLDQVQHHPGRAVTASDVCLGVLPLAHIFGLNVMLGSSLLVGARLLLIDRFDVESALDLIERHHVTILLGAPTMYAGLAALPPRPDDQRRFAEVRLAISGAAPLPDEVADICQERFHLTIRQGYGLTEASPVVASSVIGEPPRRGSIGVPIPGVQVRLVDDEGEDALAGDPGEIWVRGPNVFRGYWEDDEATASALTPDGWLRTGDIAVAGDDGELYIVDRVKDLIIVSGFNVFPAEVEAVLLQHPGVAEVAVVGEPDPLRGEAIHAFVVPTRGTDGSAPTPDELIAFCREQMARYKCPSEVSVVASLPHGLGGKLLRRALRAS